MDPELEPVSDDRSAGFTLIELLVTIAILAVLALGATLALPRGADRAQNDMAQFQRQFHIMQQLAVTGRQSRGLVITAEGMRQAMHHAAAQPGLAPGLAAGLAGGLAPESFQPTWQISQHVLRWRGSVTFVARSPRVLTQDETQNVTPGIQFLANGRSSAFAISFKRGSTPAGQCHSDGLNGLKCSAS